MTMVEVETRRGMDYCEKEEFTNFYEIIGEGLISKETFKPCRETGSARTKF